MKKPKLTLIIPLTLLFVLISSSFTFLGGNTKESALPAMGYHPETNSIVLATPGVGLEQVNAGPWIFSQVPNMEDVWLSAFAIDEDVEDADIDPSTIIGVQSDHGLWKCEWYVSGHSTPIATDTDAEDLGLTEPEWGSARVFDDGHWDITSATTGPGAWITTAGSYDIYAIIYDLAGNTVSTDTVTIWIDPTGGLPFTMDLPEWAYMSGDLMRFTADVADIEHIHLIEIAGPDGSGGTQSWSIAETNLYGARHTSPNVFRYGWDGTDYGTLIYEMPTWLLPNFEYDGLYNFTFEYSQLTGLSTQYTVEFIELDNYARPFQLTNIRGLREISGVWTQLPNLYLQDGDMIEFEVSYTDGFMALPSIDLENQNGTLWIDFTSIDTAATGWFQLNDWTNPDIVYQYGVSDTFLYNYTIVSAVPDGDYYIPIYSKSILGHYEYEDQADVRVDIDNDAIDFTWKLNSPTGIYENGDTIYITIDMVNPDPSTWITTKGPYTFGGAGNYPYENAYGPPGTETYLTSDFITTWDVDDEADVAKLDDDTFHIQFTFNRATDPNRDGFWYVNVTAGDGNPNTPLVTYTIPIFFDYALGDLEIWNVRYPTIHPNSADSHLLGVDLDGIGTSSTTERLNSELEVVVTGRDLTIDPYQGVACNIDHYTVYYNTSTISDWAPSPSTSVSLNTDWGENWVTFTDIGDDIRNLSVTADNSPTYVHYMNATTPDHCYANFPTSPPGPDFVNLLSTITPPVITGTYGADVIWQTSTSQYTAKPNDYTLSWSIANNDGAQWGTDCAIFNTTSSNAGGSHPVFTGWPFATTVKKYPTCTGSGTITQADFGTLVDATTPAPDPLNNVDWYFFLNSSDANGNIVYYRFEFTTDNEFDDVTGTSVVWTAITNTHHDTDIDVEIRANDLVSDIAKLEVYYTDNVINHVNPIWKLSPDPTPTGAQVDDWNTYQYTFEDLSNGDYNFYIVPFDSHGHTPLDWPAGVATGSLVCNETWYIETPAWVNITSPLDIMDADGFDNDGATDANKREHFAPTDGARYMGSLRNGEQISWVGHSNGGLLEYLVLNDTDGTAAVGEWGLFPGIHDADILRPWSSSATWTVTGFSEGGYGPEPTTTPFRIFILVRDAKHLDASNVKTDDNGLFYTCNARNGTDHSNYGGAEDHQEDTAALAIMTLAFFIDDTKPLIDTKTFTEGTGDGKLDLELYSDFKTGIVDDTDKITDDDEIRVRIRLNSTQVGAVHTDPDGDDYDASGDLYLLWELVWQNGTTIARYDYSDGYYDTPLIPATGIADGYDAGYGGEENAYEFVYTLDETTPGWADLDGSLTIHVYVFDYAMLIGGDGLSQAPDASVTVTIDMTDPDLTVDYYGSDMQDMYALHDAMALLVDTEENNWTVTADFSEFDTSFSATRVYVEDTCVNGEYIVTYNITDVTGKTSGWHYVTVTVEDAIGRDATALFWTGLDVGSLSLDETDRFGSKFLDNYLWINNRMGRELDDLVLNVTAYVTTEDHFFLNDDSIMETHGYNNLPLTINYGNVTGGRADYPTKPWKWYHWLIPITVPADLAASVNWSRVTLCAYGSPSQVDPDIVDDPDMWRGTVQSIVYYAWVDNEDPELLPQYGYGAMAAEFTIQFNYDYTGTDLITVYRAANTGAFWAAPWQAGAITLLGGNYGYIDGVPTGGSIPAQADGQYYLTAAEVQAASVDPQGYGHMLYYPALIGWDNTKPDIGAGSFTPSAAKPTQSVKMSLTVTDAGCGVASVTVEIPTWTGLQYSLTNAGGDTWEGTVYAPYVEGTFNTKVTAKDALGNKRITNKGPAITVDAAAPGINAFVASDYTPIVGDTVTFTLALDDSVYNVDMYVAGSPVTPTVSPLDPNVWTYDYTTTTVGPVGVLVTVSDDVWSTSTYLTIDVQSGADTTPPVIISFDKTICCDVGYLDEPIGFAVSVYDNVGVVAVTITVDGTTLTLTQDGNTWTGEHTFTEEGIYTAIAHVEDAEGNVVEESNTFEIIKRKVVIDAVYWMGGAIILIMLVGLGLMFLRKGGAA